MIDKNSTPAATSNPKLTWMQRGRALLRRHWVLAIAALAGVAAGGGAFATWLTVIEHTNHTEFCISCHVMKATVYEEYKKSSHYSNKFGVQVGCPDCHVPQYSWYDEARAKVATVGELYAFFFLGMDKVENFDKVRGELAKDVWAKFEATNARECRHCHDYGSMILTQQAPSARVKHTDAATKNENCVHCHRGITHKVADQSNAEPAPTDFDLQ